MLIPRSEDAFSYLPIQDLSGVYEEEEKKDQKTGENDPEDMCFTPIDFESLREKEKINCPQGKKAKKKKPFFKKACPPELVKQVLVAVASFSIEKKSMPIFFTKKGKDVVFRCLSMTHYPKKVEVQEYWNFLDEWIQLNQGDGKFLKSVVSHMKNVAIGDKISMIFVPHGPLQSVALNVHYPHEKDRHSARFIPKEYRKKYFYPF